MTKAQIEYMAQFHVGDKVIIKNANFHKDTIGKIATIKKVIKTKMELMVFVNDGYYSYSEHLRKEMDGTYRMRKSYEYYPSAYNVEIITGKA